MPFEDFAHMWDGTDDGWTLHYFDRKEWQITVRFPGGRPTIQDIVKLRNFDEDLLILPASSLWGQLRDVDRCTLQTNVSSVEVHSKMERGNELGFQCECVCVDRSGYLAVHLNGSAMIIEDEEEAKQVTQRMIAAGVPIVETHVD